MVTKKEGILTSAAGGDGTTSTAAQRTIVDFKEAIMAYRVTDMPVLDMFAQRYTTETGGDIDITVAKQSMVMEEIDEGTTAVLGKPETFLGEMTEVVGQFATGYALVGYITKLGNLGKAYYTKEAITTAAFFDPDEGLIMNAIESATGTDLGLLSDIFAIDEDDSPLVKQLKNTLEAVGMIGIGSSVYPPPKDM